MNQMERLSAALSGRYRLERELGAGGMATVYLAHDVKHERKVALKVLKPELAAVLGAERFVVEIRTTASLSHPHILPLFDSGEADGFLFYVMPFIDGETLRTKLDRETQFGVDESLRIATEVADALQYAHEHGVIHRDIKPENILLQGGRPMVADFGIALAVSAAAGGRMTETGLSLGTPHYMSPEQATAEKEITGRSDVYSLASVLFEMLTGNPPHTGASAQQIIMKIIAEPAEMVTKYRKTVPPHVAAAVGKALEKLPADRFESARAFAEALRNPGFTTAQAAMTGAGGSRAIGVSQRLFAAVSAVAVVGLGLAAWGWSRSEPVALPTTFTLDPGDSVALSVQTTNYRVALSLDGRAMVFVGRRVGAPQPQLFLRRLDDLTLQVIPGTEGAYNPTFSPDGRRIAFMVGGPRAVKVLSLAGGSPVTLTDSLVDNGGVTWSDDGYLYYDGHLAGDGIARIRETGGAPPEIASTPADSTESWHAGPSALPGGRGFLFHIARERGAQPFDIGVLDSRTGAHRVLLTGTNARYLSSGHLVYVTAEGDLMAVRFDLDGLRTIGEPFNVGNGVSTTGLARVDVAVAANGTILYVAGSANAAAGHELVWVTRDGVPTAVDPAWGATFRGRARISPDGRRVALGAITSAAIEVWVKELDRGPANRFPVSGATPVWTPDGKHIVYSNGTSVLSAPADGSTLPREILRSSQLLSPLDVGADGRWLVAGRREDIVAWRIGVDSAPIPLIADAATERRPALSPNGRWIAYESDESGQIQVFVRPFPDVNTAKFIISTNGGQAARWSRDGRELLFLDAEGRVTSVPVTTEGVFTHGTPRVLFSGGPFILGTVAFDVAPDGRLLMARLREGADRARDAMVLVQHFDEVVRQRAPR
jgi:eukaryotic-like serine/threonine-protein kinase